MIPQTAAMIQMNAQTIANIQKITLEIALLDEKIQSCREARTSGKHHFANIAVHTDGVGSNSFTALPRDCHFLLDIIEIMHRRERQRQVERLDEIGIVLTDQAEIGDAPVWPTMAQAPAATDYLVERRSGSYWRNAVHDGHIFCSFEAAVARYRYFNLPENQTSPARTEYRVVPILNID